MRSLWSALKPWHQGVYINSLGAEEPERVRQSYGPQQYDRLQALESEYDPDNFSGLTRTSRPS